MLKSESDPSKEYYHIKQEYDNLKLAYNNLLHDVLSFNEIISKKDNTKDILILVLRITKSIIDFVKGDIYEYHSGEFTKIHTISTSTEFDKRKVDFDKLESILKSKEIGINIINENFSEIHIPITTKANLIGVISIVFKNEEDTIKQQDIDLLWILASISAIEYESILMSNRTELLSIMLSSLEKINSEDKLENLLYLILNNLKQIVPAASFQLILRDKLLEASNNIKYCITEIHSYDETCILVNQCIKNKEPLFIKKLSKCQDCEGCTERYLHEKIDGSLLLLPLNKVNTCYGVISIFDKDSSGVLFNQYNRHIIEIFAKQATIAVNNAVLYDQQKKTNQKLAITNEELNIKNAELDLKTHEIMLSQQKLQKAHDELSKWSKIVGKELETAGMIQKAILSKIDKIDNLEVSVFYQPHHSIGGDYFGIVSLDDHRTLIYIGDVSGKGVPAAITTGFLKNEFSFFINQLNITNEISPGRILTEVNKSSLNVFNYTEQFTSAWCGLFDTAKGILTYSSAGHDYPLVLKEKIFFIDENLYPIMGLSDSIIYSDQEISFSNSDKILIYTDGITDQEKPNGDRLNREWLLNCVKEDITLSSDKMCDHIINSFREETKDTAQHDDMLIIVIAAK